MTLMSWLLAFAVVSLSSCLIVCVLVIWKTQIAWMRAFGEQHGVNLSTDVKEVEKTPLKEKPKFRIPVPIPGADVIRQMRQSR